MTLLVVDLQRVFADTDSPWAAPRFDEILPRVAALVADVPDEDVVVTRFVAPAEPEGAWRGYYDEWPFARQPRNSELWDLVEPVADRAALDYPTFGKWDARLAARAGDELVVVGVATDCCVLSTVLAAADAGVAVRVVADACAGSSDDAHRQALEVMARYAPLVAITTTGAELNRS